MNIRASVYLTCACLQYRYTDPLGEAEHVDSSHDTGLGGLHRIELVVDGAGRARQQVVYLVHLHLEGKGDVVTQDFEVWMIEKVGHISLGSGEEVVNADDLTPRLEQPLA
jgi:hypothetical protein